MSARTWGFNSPLAHHEPDITAEEIRLSTVVAMVQTPVAYDVGDVRLQGTQVLPADPSGLVVLVSGSGPIDRDSNHRRLPLGVMRLVAESLEAAGWGSVRYDKRGAGASTGDYWTAGLLDNIADARAVVTHVRAEFDGPVLVAGHSEGAVIAADLARDGDLVDGAILLSGVAGTGEQTLRWQAQQLEPQVPAFARAVMRVFGTGVTQQQDKQLAKLAASTRDTYRANGVARINARWFREFLSYDAGEVLADAAVPLLAVTGSKDVQTPASDLEVMASIVGDGITTVLAPDVDHLLRHEPKPVSSPRGYRKQVGKPLDPAVTDALTTWLADRFS